MLRRRWVVVGAGAVMGVIAMAAASWACVSGALVTLSASQAKAGQEVGIKGVGFPKTDSVAVRFGSLSGPVVATLTPSASAPFGNAASGTFTVPADTRPGDYVVIATQSSPNGNISNAPVRVLLSVVGEGGTAPVVGAPRGVDTVARQAELTVTDDSVSVWSLALAAIGVAGIGMFLAGIAALVAGRQGREPLTARQRS